MIKFGSINIGNVLKGSTEINRVYTGLNLIWRRFVLVTEDLNYSSKTQGINIIQHEWTFDSVRVTQLYTTTTGNGFDSADYTVYVKENGSWVQVYFNGDVNTATFTINFDKTITGIKIVWAGSAFITRTVTGKITKYYKGL
jgi:hypothetical protein